MLIIASDTNTIYCNEIISVIHIKLFNSSQKEMQSTNKFSLLMQRVNMVCIIQGHLITIQNMCSNHNYLIEAKQRECECLAKSLRV